MQKFAAWLRRHRVMFLLTGIVFGLTLLVWAYFNAPVNINRMQPGDWQDTKIQSIGTATVEKLQAHGPYSSMQDIDRVSGIGPVKMAQIQRHFTTWDTAKPDVWYLVLLTAVILTFGCGLALWWHWFKQRKNAQWLEKVVGDKTVKR